MSANAPTHPRDAEQTIELTGQTVERALWRWLHAEINKTEPDAGNGGCADQTAHYFGTKRSQG